MNFNCIAVDPRHSLARLAIIAFLSCNYFSSDMNLKYFTFIALFFLIEHPVNAATTSRIADYSGEYLCKGNNVAVGDYEVTVQLKKNRRNSTTQVAVYDLVTHTENKQSYTGQALVRGKSLALTFKLSDAKYAEFSTGLGQFTTLTKTTYTFKNDYYEPDDTGGNYGQETCTMKKPVLGATTAKKKTP